MQAESTLVGWKGRGLVAVNQVDSALKRIAPVITAAKLKAAEAHRIDGVVTIPVGESRLEIAQIYLLDRFGSFGQTQHCGLQRTEVRLSRTLWQCQWH